MFNYVLVKQFYSFAFLFNQYKAQEPPGLLNEFVISIYNIGVRDTLYIG